MMMVRSAALALGMVYAAWVGSAEAALISFNGAGANAEDGVTSLVFSFDTDGKTAGSGTYTKSGQEDDFLTTFGYQLTSSSVFGTFSLTTVNPFSKTYAIDVTFADAAASTLPGADGKYTPPSGLDFTFHVTGSLYVEFPQFDMADFDGVTVSGPALTVSSVPLPASLPLFAVGLLLTGLLSRRSVHRADVV